jgi:hypothetical protein
MRLTPTGRTCAKRMKTLPVLFVAATERPKRPALAVRPPLHTKLGARRHCLYYPVVSDLITNRETGWLRFYLGQSGCSFWTPGLLFMVPCQVRRVLVA